MSNQILIRGGRVVTMANGRSETVSDVLVSDGRIVQVAPSISASSAEVINATDMIVAPGFVDTHRHVWQTQMRTVATDWSLLDYLVYMRRITSTLYTADDTYLGNYVGALEAVNAGITTLIDHCHILNTPEHADSAARALQDAGIRAIFCYGTFENVPRIPSEVPVDPRWRLAAARELRRGRLSSDSGLVRFGFAPYEGEAMPFDRLVDEIRFARSLDSAAISLHVALGPYDKGVKLVEKLHQAGVLGPDLLFVHGASLSDHELDLIKLSGGGISSTPETELQMGMGFPVCQRARDHGIRVGLGVDIVSNYSGDMFMPMRLGLQSTRALRNHEIGRLERAPAKISPRAHNVLRMATLGGAEAIHMEGEIGSLEVGKRADIILVRTDAIHMTPTHDAIGGLVLNARPDDVDTVMVDGNILKRNGRLAHGHWPSLRQRFKESCDRIISGYRSVDAAGDRKMMESAFGERLINPETELGRERAY
jgi:cytosine/adenosine deaminase-related metal-dependent hydrolase